MSPAPSSVIKTPPGQKRVAPRSLTSNDMPKERVSQQPTRQEYLVPLPTPMPTPEDLNPLQRRPIPTEPRHAEHRAIEPRHIEPRAVEPRPVEPRSGALVDTPPVEPLCAEARQAEQYQAEPRPVEPEPTEQHHVGPRDEQSVEQGPTEQNNTDQRQVESRSIETRPTQDIASRPIHEESRHMKQQLQMATTSDQAADSIFKAATSRQESKRKATDFPIVEHTNVVSSSKRPRTGDKLPEHAEPQSAMSRSPRSTRRSLGAAKESRVKRTITFQEVYQDGKSQFKHKIFAWPKDSNTWCIVRCDEHQVHFNNGNPLHGAAKHIHSPQHGHLEKRHDLAMEVCGYLVLDCNAELAALNNREFERALKEDKYQVFNMNLLTKEGRRRLTDGPVQNTDAVGSLSTNSTPAKKKPKPLTSPLNELTQPEECNFYLGFWAPTKKWYMLIVLPIRPDGSLREVGLKEKLQQTDLMSNVPKCYRSDRVSLQILGWQPTYMDGGAKADKREYPVMFFDSPVQKHSVGWLPATKLRPVDLFDPPDDADKKGLAMARDWFAMRMMHRKDWEQFKRLGPGEPPSPASSEGETGKGEQWAALRSAHTDDMSPIRDKSNGPGHFFGSGSSEEGSDAGDMEDPMTIDIGPIPEPVDSNYVEDGSGSDDSDVDVEMEDGASKKAAESDITGAVHPSRRTSISHPGTQRSVHAQEMNLDEDKPGQTITTVSQMETTQPDPATPRAEFEKQTDMTAVLEQENYRKSAQAKAAAAVKEAANRSRASSENPEVLARSPTLRSQQHSTGSPAEQALSGFTSRPPLADHGRSRSEDTLTHGGAVIFTSSGTGKLDEARHPSDLHSILDTDQRNTQAETTSETHVDPYKRFEAIRAQMNGLTSRPASVLVHEGNGTNSPFGPPPQSIQAQRSATCVPQQSPNVSHIVSPPLSQSSAIVPARSSSTTPTPGLESGRSTPKILIPEGTRRWKAVRTSSSGSVQQPHASFVGTSSSPKKAPLQPLMPPTPQLGTPIHDKPETFDVSQFYDSEGPSWAREGPNKPFLRLCTDPMRKWAETARGSSLKATIEPAQIEWIETDHPKSDRDKQRVSLMTKHHRKVVLIFETNSANGRSQGAALQGRLFVSWVKRINERVEWRDE